MVSTKFDKTSPSLTPTFRFCPDRLGLFEEGSKAARKIVTHADDIALDLTGSQKATERRTTHQKMKNKTGGQPPHYNPILIKVLG
jgi:hypothetical protein